MDTMQKQKPEQAGNGSTELIDLEPTPVGVGDELKADGLFEAVDGLADEMEIRDYTDPVSGINHGHGPDKHDVRKAFGVRDEFVEKHFHFAPNDHAAVWELHYRKDEFVASGDQLFSGKANDHSATWKSIERTKKSAPVPDQTHRTLKGF